MATAPLNLKRIFKGTLKVLVSFTKPHAGLPWSMRNSYSSSGSGFVIKHKGRFLIVTNAHVVENATQVQVRFHGAAVKTPATILAVAHDADLALLDCEGLQEEGPSRVLELSDRVPELQEALSVVGFPVGGDQLSITTGVCSRLDFSAYSHSSRENLCVQTDSAINSGNSGGPCFDASGKVVGVAFQSMDASDAQLAGYCIPQSVLRRVLLDFDKRGDAVPFGRLGFFYQTVENAFLASTLKIPAGKSGVLISRVIPVSDAAKKLKAGDVVCSIDGVPIAGDGTVAFREDERVGFGYLLTLKSLGDSVALEILRDGKLLTIALPLEDVPDLVSKHLYNQRPSYCVFGGLVFTPLSEPYLAACYGKEWDSKAPVRYVSLAYHGQVEKPGQQVVALSQILQNRTISGFEIEDFVGSPLESINGIPINNMADVAAILRVHEAIPPPFVLQSTAANGAAASSSSTGSTAASAAAAVGSKRKKPSSSSSSSSSDGSEASSPSAVVNGAGNTSATSVNAPSRLVAIGFQRQEADVELKAKIEAASTAAVLRFEFMDGKVVILPRNEAIAATKEVMATHAIPSALSQDLASHLLLATPPAATGAGAGAVAAAATKATAAAAAAAAGGGAGGGGGGSKKAALR